MHQLTPQQQIDSISQLIDLDSNNKKLLFIVPESAGDIFLSTSLLKSLKDMYSPVDIYFSCKPEFKDILKNNPYIKKVINYYPIMESQIHMEGTGEWPGIFDICIMATILTQRYLNYLNNGIGKIAFSLRA